MTSSTHSMMTLISEDRLSLTSTNASTDEGISSAEEDQEYSFRLSQELADLALKELGENDETRESCLLELRQWISSRPDLSKCRKDSKFLLRFLRAQKFNVEKTCKVLEKYLTMRVQNPHWFTKLDPENEKIQELVESGFVFVLPGRDSSGRKVVFNRATAFDLSTTNNADIMKVMQATVETLMDDEENQIRGITYIFYCKDLNLSHVSIWTPSDAARLFGTCEKNLSIRHRDINLVSLPFTLWAVIEFVKQLLSAKIKSRINIGDEKKLLAKFGSEMLPQEIGGTSASAKEMARTWLKEMVAKREVLLGLDDMLEGLEDVEDEDLKEAKEEKKSTGGFWSYMGM